MAAACVISTVGDFLMFWRRKYTFPELFIANAFVCGELLLFQIFMVPIFLLGGQMGINDYIRTTCIVLISIYLVITKYQFFDGANNRVIVIRILLSLVLYVILAYVVTNQILYPVFTKK